MIDGFNTKDDNIVSDVVAMCAQNDVLIEDIYNGVHDLRQALQAFTIIRDVLVNDVDREKIQWIRRQLDKNLISASHALEVMNKLAREGMTQKGTPPAFASGEARVVDQEPVSPGAGGRQPRLFIVEDNVPVRDVMHDLLQRHGYVVETFGSGEAFFDACRPADRGCVLVDAILPGMSGCEIIRRLKAENYSVRAVMMTGGGDASMAVRAMKAGAADFIEKPVSAQELIACIESAILDEESAGPGPLRREGGGSLEILTDRQRQILALIMNGASNKSVAAALGLSQRTVESHRAAIMKEARAKSLAALVKWALAAH